MSITRRRFLRKSAFAFAGASAVSSFFVRAPNAITISHGRRKRLVVIFLRGAADGLNMVVPHGEPAYYAMRPTINIPRSAVIDLDGFFGFHPAMSSLEPLWQQGQLAIVHATGSPRPSRKHFEAQDFMECAIPGERNATNSWMSRCASEEVRWSGEICLAGRDFEAMPGAQSLSGSFAENLRQLSQFIKTNPQTQVLSSDMGGWDHHSNQGAIEGEMADSLREFSDALDAFWSVPGNLREDTVVVTMSEFGRSVGENNRGGTDHGHGNVMFVLGANVKGRKVYGDWPGLGSSQLHAGFDLAVTTDCRRVLGEVIYRHLGKQNLSEVFPKFDNNPERFLNLIG